MPAAGVFSIIVGLVWLFFSFFIQSSLLNAFLAFGGGAFLIAGGALTLSISLILGLKGNEILLDETVILTKSWAWYTLSFTILMFLIVKIYLIRQSYLRETMNIGEFNLIVKKTNFRGWLFGIVGFLSFIIGMSLLLKSAILILYS